MPHLGRMTTYLGRMTAYPLGRMTTYLGRSATPNVHLTSTRITIHHNQQRNACHVRTKGRKKTCLRRIQRAKRAAIPWTQP